MAWDRATGRRILKRRKGQFLDDQFYSIAYSIHGRVAHVECSLRSNHQIVPSSISVILRCCKRRSRDLLENDYDVRDRQRNPGQVAVFKSKGRTCQLIRI